MKKYHYLMYMFFGFQVVMASNDKVSGDQVDLSVLQKTNTQISQIIVPAAMAAQVIKASEITIKDLQTKEFYEKTAQKTMDNAQLLVVPVAIGAAGMAQDAIRKKAMQATNEYLGSWMTPLTEAISIVGSCIIIEDFIFNSFGIEDFPGRKYAQTASCSAFYTAFAASVAYNMSSQQVVSIDQVDIVSNKNK